MVKSPKVFRVPGRALAVDKDRGSARARGYTTAWDKAALAYRQAHPLCEYCAAGAFGDRRVSPSQRVDHLYPQRRYPGVFWNKAWWVGSCDDCDAAKQALEHLGRRALDALAARLGRPIMSGAAGPS